MRYLPAVLAAGVLLLVAAFAIRPGVETPQAKGAAPAVESSTSLYPARRVAESIPARRAGFVEPIVVAECRLSVFEKQEVPSQREGVLDVLGTDEECDETIPPERFLVRDAPDGPRCYRRLKEGDVVRPGQLLGQIDDRLARIDLGNRLSKILVAKAELGASEKTRDEAKVRFDIQVKLATGKATSQEEVRSTKLTWERFVYEAKIKKESIEIAEQEAKQAARLLEMHEIRAGIGGVVKAIYKRPGEALKPLEPVLQIHNLARLRVEGLIETESLSRLRSDSSVRIEAAVPFGPAQVIKDHLQPISAVAVCQQRGRTYALSASEDGCVRVHRRDDPSWQRVYVHPAPVRCLTATGPDSSQSLYVTGADDGLVRIWDLEGASEPIHVLRHEPRGEIGCVALSPDGRFLASAGEARSVCIWDISANKILYRLPAGHRAAITSLAFTPQSTLVSAARDGTVKVWKLLETEARLEQTLDRRAGVLRVPGVSTCGAYVLFDEGRNLRILSLADRSTRDVLDKPTDATPFANFAIFSPDSRLILTAALDGPMQLWRAPTATTRARELRSLVTRQPSAVTCAAFAPDGAFLLTGTRDNQVLLWDLPSGAEMDETLPARLTLLERAVETSHRHVRIWAEVDNARGQMLPGTAVKLIVEPSEGEPK